MKICYRNELLDITLKQYGGKRYSYSVIYGLQQKHELGYAEAANELGECLMHALGCEGKLDNE